MDEEDIDEINEILRNIDNKYSGTVTAKTGEIFPTNNVPVLSIQNDKTSLSLMKWGFPKWDSKGVIINAKSETAAKKKMFSKSLEQRRCVIPSTGFYEWAKVDEKPKAKYRFNAPGSPMLYMAGLYTDYTSTKEELTEKFVILTRSANTSIKDIHNRMPVILFKDELVRWLKDYDFAADVMCRDNINLIREATV
jgi:putative SOS response-associated peptidase YedK